VNLPGQHLAGVHEGLAFLRAVKTGGIDSTTVSGFLADGGCEGERGFSRPCSQLAQGFARGVELTLKNRRVLVLGGGDTAMDCVRSACALAPRRPWCIAVRKQQLRAAKREAKAAREEGAKFVFEHRPLVIEGDAQCARRALRDG